MLESLPLSVDSWRVPPEVEAVCVHAEAQAAHFLAGRSPPSRIPRFQASNLYVAYQALEAVTRVAPGGGRSFCEWGSGLGGVTCLAATLGFDACGIEIEADLIHAAREMASQLTLPATFHHGSFEPAGAHGGELDTAALQGELGFDPTRFDVVYAYPWPAEEGVVAALFEHGAPDGSLLISYRGGMDIRLLRQRRT